MFLFDHRYENLLGPYYIRSTMACLVGVLPRSRIVSDTLTYAMQDEHGEYLPGTIQEAQGTYALKRSLWFPRFLQGGQITLRERWHSLVGLETAIE